MKITTTILVLLCLGFTALGQYSVGHTTFTFNDPNRTGGFGSGGGTGRQIQSEIYYPAATAGDDVTAATGTFPVIVFGHGFVMSWDAYENIWDKLIEEGYIMVFPRTEGGFNPTHSEFGLDLALCAANIHNLNNDASSPLYNHIDPNTAIAGHSMGGGSTLLAGENNSQIKTIIGMAPAETTPSAISAASNVSVPALILSGSADGVTPAVDHHSPIYDSLGSNCKHFVSITGGAHCYFANSNFNCDFGEGTASSGISVTRTEQHAIMFDAILPWLDYHLKGECNQWNVFENFASTDARITSLSSCSIITPDNSISNSSGTLTALQTGANYQWVDCNDNNAAISGANAATYTPTTNGDFACEITLNGCTVLSPCESITGIGITETASYSFSVFPNPSNGSLTLESTSAGQFELFNIAGSKISYGSISKGANLLEFDIPNGIYILEIQNSDRQFHQVKLLIEK